MIFYGPWYIYKEETVSVRKCGCL